MNRILVAVFPSEVGANEGWRALEELDRAGTITLYAAALVVNEDASRVTVKAAAGRSPLGMPVALLTGSLLGPLAGPVGLAVAAGVGTLGRVLHDLALLGVEEDFLTEIADRLSPGTAAVIAEVWEDRITPVDERIAAMGGSLLRRVRKEIVDAWIERDVAALRDELASLAAELASALPEHRAHLEQRIDGVRAELRTARQRAIAVLDAMTRECDAKVESLEARAGILHGEARARLEARIAEVRTQCRRRREKVREVVERAAETSP